MPAERVDARPPARQRDCGLLESIDPTMTGYSEDTARTALSWAQADDLVFREFSPR